MGEETGIMKFVVFYKKEPSPVLGPFSMFDERDLPTDIEDFYARWVKVRELHARGMEEVFMEMQGEMWSPNREARPLIRKLGLKHTSMSVGDIVLVPEKNELHLVADLGFTKVPFPYVELVPVWENPQENEQYRLSRQPKSPGCQKSRPH